MPILEFTVVLRDGESLAQDLAQRLADAAAPVLAAAPATVWVTLDELPGHRYAENGAAAADTPRPVFIRITQAGDATPADRAAEARALVTVLAPLLARDPAHVHLIYAPPGAGRVAFGGRLRTD
jgi:phenylpyruvate tautomerase PptA (4-oxalocrotonate tautomerase family)